MIPLAVSLRELTYLNADEHEEEQKKKNERRVRW